MTGYTHAVDKLVTLALDDAFPERDVSGVHPTGPSWNDQNKTVRVEFTDRKTVFLKVALDGNGSRITRECAVIDYVGTHCDVVAPSVITNDITNEPPYMITEPMRERCFAPQWPELSWESRITALRQIGNALAEVNTQKFEQHADIIGGGRAGLILDTGSLTDVLVQRINEMHQQASSDRFETYFDEVITAVEKNQERLNDAPATLIHSDPAMSNIFRSETTLGFIDWELAHVGDPARELHRAQSQLIESPDFEKKEQLITALQDGYRQSAGGLPVGLEKRTPIYDAVRFLGTAGFFDKAVEFSDGSSEEFARWVETEMNRRLNKIR